MKLDVLVFGAHPDDAELGCGGTIISMIESGKKVGIIDLTQGELGSKGDAETRERESHRANEIMGVIIRENLLMSDGFFSHNMQNSLKIIETIRKYKPDLILTNAPSDRHPDHGRACKMVTEACFLSGLVKIETQIKGKWQEKWRPKLVFHYIQDRYLKPDFVFDITPYFDKKMEAIAAYSTQFFNPDDKTDPTPISTKEFWDFLAARAREFGRSGGVEFAEGFIAERTLAVNHFGAFL
ncbi:MAG TPA: bacillithiol biosynthesis deacetylase BshB1 [Luteibaculaceae bacterium]|nr:bacillithiol biosynthesis deacetylase BshB1 [Luteibaculaceae bacterium]